MASDLELLFSLKASNTQAKAVIADTRADVQKLKVAYTAEVNEMATAAAVANGRVQLSAKELAASIIASRKRVTEVDEREAKRRADVADAEYAREVRAAEKAAAAEVKVTETAAARIAAIRKEMTRIVEAENLKQQRVLGGIGISAATGGGIGTGALASNAAGLGRSAEQAEAKLAALEAEAVSIDSTFVSTAGSVGVAGTALTGLAGPLGIAAIAIGAVTLGLVGLGDIIFNATKAAAAYGDEIYKAGQKTGLSSEFMSVAKLRVEETNGSFQNFSTGLARFEIALSKSLTNPTSEASKAFETLHLKVDDLKAALPDDRVKAFGKALANVTDVAERNRIAVALGSRGFLEQIKVVEDLGTRYDELHDKAEALGLIFSGPAAKAAHEFNVQLHDITLQFKGMEVTLGSEVLPALSKLLDLFTNIKIGGKSLADFLGKSIAFELENIRQKAILAVAAIETLAGISAGSTVEQIYKQFQKNVADLLKDVPKPTEADQPTNDTPFPGKDPKDKERTKAAKEYAAALKEARDAEEQVQIAEEANARRNKKDLEGQTQDYEEYAANAKKYNEQILDAEVKRAYAEKVAADVAYRKKVLTLEQWKEKVHESAVQIQKAREKYEAEDQKIDDDAANKKNEADIRLRERNYKTAIEADKRYYADIKRLEDGSFITHEEAENRKQAADQVAYDRERARIQAAIDDVKTDVQTRLDLQQQLIDMDGEHKQQVVANERAITEAKSKDNDETQKAIDLEIARNKAEVERTKRATERRELNDPTSTRSLFGSDFTDNLELARLRIGLVGKSLQDLGADFRAVAQTASQFFTRQSAQAGNFASIAASAFNSLADAVGRTLENIILTGKTGPAWLRKMTAEVLAQVAAQAAVKAIFELAAGFADLFWNPPAAGAHFTSAALYGSIAGVAAVAGRVVAGNSFNQPAAAGGASGGSGGSSSGSTANQTQTIIQGRNQSPQVIIIHHEHELKLPNGFTVAELKAASDNNDHTLDQIFSRAVSRG